MVLALSIIVDSSSLAVTPSVLSLSPNYLYADSPRSSAVSAHAGPGVDSFNGPMRLNFLSYVLSHVENEYDLSVSRK